jgi:hypothetical protein
MCRDVLYTAKSPEKTDYGKRSTRDGKVVLLNLRIPGTLVVTLELCAKGSVVLALVGLSCYRINFFIRLRLWSSLTILHVLFW